jgi:hypothetical protein
MSAVAVSTDITASPDRVWARIDPSQAHFFDKSGASLGIRLG